MEVGAADIVELDDDGRPRGQQRNPDSASTNRTPLHPARRGDHREPQSQKTGRIERLRNTLPYARLRVQFARPCSEPGTDNTGGPSHRTRRTPPQIVEKVPHPGRPHPCPFLSTPPVLALWLKLCHDLSMPYTPSLVSTGYPSLTKRQVPHNGSTSLPIISRS